MIHFSLALRTFFSTTLLLFSVVAGASTGLKIVPNKEVCMVTDMHFTKPQIPVTVEEKTYYGCCENCKATLSNTASARKALDPHTKKPVDKASAVIAANSDGSVLYFENKESFEAYSKSKEPTKK